MNALVKVNVGNSRDKRITQRQLDFLRRLYDYLCENGEYPTLRQMVDWFDFKSPNSVMSGYIKPLVKKGFLLPFDDEQRSRKIRFAGLVLTPSFLQDEAGKRLHEHLKK